MRQNNRIKKLKRGMVSGMALILCILLLCPVFVQAEEKDGNTIHIQTEEDLKELAENCRLDTWSQGKTVILDNDLTLDEESSGFFPIPSFGGVFEGNGHEISGFTIEDEESRAGLFDTVQKGAEIKNLTVSGQVIPGGDGDTIGGIAGKNYGKIVKCTFEGTIQGTVSVGGIAGINETTGQLISCRFQGTVTGEHYVGGIAGQNTGSMTQCENSGDINTIAVEVSADFPDLSLLGTTESVPAGTDIGGIAGFSSGVIQSCTNTGNVGYEHMGYNVGGIAGRQSGYLDGCSNTGEIRGRKDVGGILGQLEPQVTLRYDEDLIDQLGTELDTLQKLTDQAAADARTGSGNLSGSVDSLISNISTAKDAAGNLGEAITDWGNENIGQINDLSAGISRAISQAEPILEEMDQAAEILEKAASLLQQASEKAGELGEQGETAAAELKQASQELQKASDAVNSCAAHLCTALETAGKIVNGEASEEVLQSILDELNASGTEAKNVKTSLESAISHANAAKTALEEAGEPAEEGLQYVAQAMEEMNLTASSFGEIADEIQEVVSMMAEEPTLSFAPVDSSVTSKGDELDNALSQMISSASGLQNSISSSSDTLISDFEAINNQIAVIADLLQQQMEQTEETDAFEDVSDEEDGEASSGKIRNASNSGEVAGDVNVGGVAGSMSVEYDFDPEDDLTKEGDRSLDFQYRTLAVVTECTNEGSVSAKKNYAGGIIGRMDLGAVKTCESYGSVESTNGDYVGGIAGLTRATIRNSYAKCSLSGEDYIGGIVGTGEENSEISGCYTLVEIEKANRYSGAVSGTETGEFSGNYFVSDTLAGLGRISYAGKAEPLTFDAMKQIEGMPEEMTQFTLRFLVEEEEVKSVTFSYGDSFGEDDFPEIPVKDGYFASWDTEDLKEIHFDKTVTAEYHRYVLTLSSEHSRESGRSVFLVDGNFDDQAVLTVSKVKQKEPVNGKPAKEQWDLECSDTSQENYTIRYLSPEETPDGYTVFVKEDGKWKKADCETFGSYLVFDVSSAAAEVAIVTSASVWIQRAVVVLLLILLLIALIWIIRKKGGEKIVGWIKSKRKWILCSLGVLLVVGVVAAILLGKKIGEAQDACSLLQELVSKEEYAMELSLDTELDGEVAHTDIDIRKTKVDQHAVTCIQKEGISLYYADGAVIMENGKAYKISDDYPDYSELMEEAARIFGKVSFTSRKNQGATVYSLTAEGENAKALLEVLLPGKTEDLTDTQKVTVKLTSQDDEIRSIQFSSEGTLSDHENTPYSLSAELKPAETDESFVVPDAVEETILSGNSDQQTPISEDLFRLLEAWTDLVQEDAFSGDLTLEATCEPVSLDETINYEHVKEKEQTIQSLRKDDLIVYFSDGTFCDQNGSVIKEDQDLTDRAHLLEVLVQICQNGEFECTDTGNDTWLYSLTLDEEAMKSVVFAAVPEAETMDITFSEGSVQILLEDNVITEMKCSCTGGLSELAEAAPVTISADMILHHNSESEIPDAVKDQLIQERKGKDEK